MASVPPQGGRKHPSQEMIPIDTTNILFICGGAFDGLEKIIESRMDKKSIGFNTEISVRKDDTIDELFPEVMPQDLVRFGLIPEFIGRVPVSVALKSLDEEALMKILTEPKNALVKQFQKLFELDDVTLEFTAEAVKTIAEKAIARNTGARGLRSIVEDALMDIMYEIPSDETIDKCIITKEVVEDHAEPELVRIDETELKKSGAKKRFV